ncbi:MAG: CHAT domain-containing protein [Vicinamibacterales bacterium]
MLSWLLVLALGLSGQAGQVAPPAPPAVDEASVERFVAAGTVDERLALVQGDQSLATEAFVRALTRAGGQQLSRGDFASAERSYEAAAWLAEYTSLSRLRIAALVSQGQASAQRGDLWHAREHLETALALAEAAGYAEGVQSAANGIGIVLRRLGDHAGALASFTRVIALAEAAGRKDGVARAYNNIGLVYQYEGNAALALDYYSRSLALKEEIDASPGDRASTIGNIGGLYDEQGDYERAIDYYKRALALVDGTTNSGGSLVTVLANLGHGYAGLRDYTTARAYFERARAAAEAGGDRGRLATILYNLGTIVRDEGDADEALTLQRRAFALRDALGDRVGIIESLTELAGLAIGRDDPGGALSYAQQAIGLASESRLLNQLWKAQTAAALAEQGLGRADAAARRYGQAIETIETLRQLTAGGDRARQMFLAERLSPYYGLAALHASAGRSFEAFEAVERGRSRALLDILSGARRTVRSLSPDVQARERSLTQAVVSWSSQLDAEAAKPSPDADRLARLDGELTRARVARDVFTDSLYEAQPDLRLARGEAPLVRPAGLPALLPDGTAIAEFVIESEQAWLYWIVRGADGPVIEPVPLDVDGRTLGRLATTFADQVASRDLGFTPSARELYAKLFSRVDRRMAGVRHLIVVPDGALWRVPFQALRTPRGRYVIEERSVSYAPSVSALAALESRRRSRQARSEFLFALADPAPAAGVSAGPSASRRGGRALPEARREVRAVSRLYGAARSLVLTGADATETALAEGVGRASVLHIATHGVVDDQHPMYSHVMLAPGLASAPGDTGGDGRLEAWEVMDLPLEADLVVLSACETARGRSTDGEGVVGLSWSLFAAGASTAVVSQWEVDSASTTQLMIGFHQHRLQDARPAAEALRAASRALIAAPATRHPFYWAGFIVVGAP